MKFINLQTFRYQSPLRVPFVNSQFTYSETNGIIIKLCIDGYCGFGEASPLANFSKESIREILWGLEEIKLGLDTSIEYDKEELFAIFKLYSVKCPTLNFALDMALLDILAQKQNKSIAKYLSVNASDSIRLTSAYKNPIPGTSVKVKISGKNIIDEIKSFKIKTKNFPVNIKYRFDFNQSASIENIIYMEKELQNYNIEYIEEPLNAEADMKEYEELKKNIKTPLAIDESIIYNSKKKLYWHFEGLANSGIIQYAVIKSSLLGDVKKVMRLIDFFVERNIKVIISSSLQSKIGNMANIHIASILSHNQCHGLNNYHFFDYQYAMPYEENDSIVNIDHVKGLGVIWDD